MEIKSRNSSYESMPYWHQSYKEFSDCIHKPSLSCSSIKSAISAKVSIKHITPKDNTIENKLIFHSAKNYSSSETGTVYTNIRKNNSEFKKTEMADMCNVGWNLSKGWSNRPKSVLFTSQIVESDIISWASSRRDSDKNKPKVLNKSNDTEKMDNRGIISINSNCNGIHTNRLEIFNQTTPGPKYESGIQQRNIKGGKFGLSETNRNESHVPNSRFNISNLQCPNDSKTVAIAVTVSKPNSTSPNLPLLIPNPSLNSSLPNSPKRLSIINDLACMSCTQEVPFYDLSNTYTNDARHIPIKGPRFHSSKT